MEAQIEAHLKAMTTPIGASKSKTWNSQNGLNERATEYLKSIKSNDPEASAYENTPKPVPCKHCGALLHFNGYKYGDDAVWMKKPIDCTCSGAVAEREEAARVAEADRRARDAKLEAERKGRRFLEASELSSMGRRFLTRRFDTFETNAANEKAYRFAKAYADRYSKLIEAPEAQEKNGLMFTGKTGTGKTHLAAAIANSLREKGEPVVFGTMIDLLAILKERFDKGGEEKVLRQYKALDLLIIDDLGKEQPTEWALTKIYQIVNARYEDFKPIIVTTNYSTDEMVKRLTPKGGDNITAAATVDRLKEMCYMVAIEGESHR